MDLAAATDTAARCVHALERELPISPIISSKVCLICSALNCVELSEHSLILKLTTVHRCLHYDSIEAQID